MRNSKFIQWICQWQEAFSIKHTHLPLNDQPWFIDYLIRGMSKEKRSLISISVWRERERGARQRSERERERKSERERAREELGDSAFLLDRIFKWHQLSLNDNEIQHKATKQTEKPQECSWTLSPWLTRASFMLLQPLSCVKRRVCVRVVCCDEKRFWRLKEQKKTGFCGTLTVIEPYILSVNTWIVLLNVN